MATRLPDPRRVRTFADTWEHRRRAAVDASMPGASDNLREWAETMNAQTRLLIAELQIFDPDVWSNLSKVCMLKAKGAAIIDPELLALFRTHQSAFSQVGDEREWDALEELTAHAGGMCANAKFKVNHLDRTNI